MLSHLSEHAAPRPRYALVALFSIVAMSACAKGDSITGGTGGSDGDGGSDGEGAGATGAGGDGVGASTTTQNSMQMNTTTGPACDEQPCKLVAPQCGCDDGLACNLDQNNARVCVTAGTATQGDPCSESNLCEPGAICVGYSDTQLSCSSFCNSNAECEAPGGLCVLTLDGAVGVTLCSDNCDLPTSSGCQLPQTSCQLGLSDADEYFTVCAPSGTGVAQATCLDTGDCAPGFACFDTTADPPDKRCFQWCNTGAPNCPADFPTCTSLDVTIGSTNIGACNP